MSQLLLLSLKMLMKKILSGFALISRKHDMNAYSEYIF